MPIRTLRIRNFKSLKDLTLDCKRVNLIIGEPNTGKSNILETLGMLSQACYGRIHSFVRLEVMTDLFYDHIVDNSISIEFDGNNFLIRSSEGIFSGEYMEKSSQGMRGRSAFQYNYDAQGSVWTMHALRAFKFYRFVKLPSFQNPKSEFLQPPDGDNLIAVIRGNKRLREVISQIFDKFGYKVLFRVEKGEIEVQKESEDILISFPYSLASETLQRLVFYLAAIYSNRDSILAFEEPEAHAFPYYTKYLAERIALDENNNQYFIATHNPYFLTAILEKTPKEEVQVFATSLDNYQTKVRALTEANKKEILSDMGYDIFFNIKDFLG